jgi:hypothetical protein
MKLSKILKVKVLSNQALPKMCNKIKMMKQAEIPAMITVSDHYNNHHINSLLHRLLQIPILRVRTMRMPLIMKRVTLFKKFPDSAITDESNHSYSINL